MSVVYFNDDFHNQDDALIGINDLAIRRGFGIFDFFRCINGKPLFIDEHLDRFLNSARLVELPLSYSKDELRDICLTLIEKNYVNEAGVRLVLTGGYSTNGFLPGKPNLIINTEPVKVVDKATRDKGVKVITHDFQREYAHIKTINYFTAIMKQKEAAKVNAFDIIYHDNGALRELTRSNLFIVDDKDIIYTPVNKILKGITRHHVMELMQPFNKITEKNITMNDLFKAKEVFTTGTTKRVLPIVQIDEHTVGEGQPGKVTRKALELFLELENSDIQK